MVGVTRLALSRGSELLLQGDGTTTHSWRAGATGASVKSWTEPSAWRTNGSARTHTCTVCYFKTMQTRGGGNPLTKKSPRSPSDLGIRIETNSFFFSFCSINTDNSTLSQVFSLFIWSVYMYICARHGEVLRVTGWVQRWECSSCSQRLRRGTEHQDQVVEAAQASVFLGFIKSSTTSQIK